VAIDTTVPNSPGWWLERLAGRLLNPTRQARLNLLDQIYRGDMPLPEGAEQHRSTYQAFQKYARSNFAETITEALRPRVVPTGVRTGVAGGESGDAEAWKAWKGSGLHVEFAEILRTTCVMGNAYAIVGPKDDETGYPVVTAEDPRQVISEHDPRHQRKILAALKYMTDDITERELLYLYMPGVVYVASRPVGSPPMVASPTVKGQKQTGLTLGTEWEWDFDLSGDLPDKLMPVVRFRYGRGVGCFEPHIDLLMRINHMILQRMVIATMQAFRQRAVKNLPETVDGQPPTETVEDGVVVKTNVIDYTDVFSADPGALWQVPEGVEFWESGQVDLTPILASVKDDVQHLAAVSRRPMYMFQPSGDIQSAVGADLSREALVHDAEDLIVRMNDACSQVFALMFRWMGDDDRAKVAEIDLMWQSPERQSLSERAAAAAQAGKDFPWRSRMMKFWGLSPTEVDRMEQERNTDLLYTMTTAPPPPPGAEPVTEPAAPGDLGA